MKKIKELIKSLINVAVIYMAILGYFYYPTKLELSYNEVSKIKKFTIRIHTKTSRASGVVYKSKKGIAYAITNAHLCLETSYKQIDKGSEIVIYKEYLIDRSTDNLVMGKFHSIDIYNDLCAIKLDKGWSKFLSPIVLANKPLKLLSKGYQSSIHPKINEFHIQSTQYIHKDFVRDLLTKYHRDSWVISSPIIKGMSGSPIFNDKLQLVGLVWGTSQLPRIGMVVGHTALTKFLKEL